MRRPRHIPELDPTLGVRNRVSAVKIHAFQTIFRERQKCCHTHLAYGGGCTPTYILLSTLTAEGRKTVRERPNRIQEVDREMEAMQVKVISQHAVVGPYDFVNIVEAPDNQTIIKASVELGARGTVKIESMPAIPIEEFIKAIKER